MNASEILSAMNAGEDKDWEFKSAKGGTPRSLWETYSAMANTDGGVIVLGVKEHEGDFEVQGLDDAAKTEKDFWTTINNRGKVSVNLLASDDVRIVPVNGKSVLIVKVPRATRRQRPVFVGQNPLEGTYRRHGDGDYLCSREEVGRMLADQADYPADCEILTGFRLEDLDKRSLDQYRNRFASRSPAHPWLKSDDRGVLEKIGGWRTDRASGQEGLTVAGLLMFGKDEAIRDPAAIPQYHVDYRERLSSDPICLEPAAPTVLHRPHRRHYPIATRPCGKRLSGKGRLWPVGIVPAVWSTGEVQPYGSSHSRHNARGVHT